MASVSGRREVLTGKAPFGIFGDGKEVAQLAMGRAFRPGDWRSGYYRDQTFMFATGMSDLPRFFAELYTNTDIEAEPASAGRQMVSHFATRILDADGRWKRLAGPYFASFVQGNLADRVRDDIHDFPDGKNVDLAGFRIDAAPQILIRLEVFARSHNDRVLDRVDHNLRIDPFFPADLIDRLKKHVRHQ